jgi:hypothetical protein
MEMALFGLEPKDCMDEEHERAFSEFATASKKASADDRPTAA